MKSLVRPLQLFRRMEALADPTRLRLLRLLEHHELGVAELCEILQSPQSTVSRHLKLLVEQGWVAGRSQGVSNLYRFRASDLDGGARQLWRVARDETGPWPTARQDQLRLARRLREREAKPRSFFARAAGRWDALRRELYGEHFEKAALSALAPREWVVADLGCGTGQLVALLAHRVERVIGIDQSAAMLAAARRRTAGLRNVELRAGDLTALPLDDACCDAALMILALTYVAAPAAAIREMGRILRPGGRAVVVDLLPHDRDELRHELGQSRTGFEPNQVETMVADAGLASTTVESLPPPANAKGPALFMAVAARAGGRSNPERPRPGR
jgi:ArsR family transcriptional regulator